MNFKKMGLKINESNEAGKDENKDLVVEMYETKVEQITQVLPREQ